MSSKNTSLFAASLLVAAGAVAADHATSEAPAPRVAQEASFSPCAAATPPPEPGHRSYDDIADDYSGGVAPAPAPARAPRPAAENPCSAGVL